MSGLAYFIVFLSWPLTDHFNSHSVELTYSVRGCLEREKAAAIGSQSLRYVNTLSKSVVLKKKKKKTHFKVNWS